MSFETFMSPNWPNSEVIVPPETQEIYADPSDWVSLLQRLAMKMNLSGDEQAVKPFDAHMQQCFVELSAIFYNAQPFKVLSQDIIQSQMRAPLIFLFPKLSYFYDLLLLSKTQINPQTTPEVIQVGLKSLDDEMHRVFKENAWGVNQAYPYVVPYWQSKVSTQVFRDKVAAFFNTKHKDYGSITPIFKHLIEQEIGFLEERVALKEICRAQLPPEISQTFLNYILPILQQQDMACIEPLKDNVVAFIRIQGNSPVSISCVNILLKNINNSNDIAQFTAICSRLSESPHCPQWLCILAELQGIYGERLTFESINSVLDKLIGHSDIIEDISALIKQASNLSWQQLQAILTLGSMVEMREAFAEADSAFRMQKELQAEMDKLSYVLSGLLEGRLVTTSTCHALWRDYLYVKALLHEHPVYYCTPKYHRDDEEMRKQLVLSTASQRELKETLVTLLRVEAHPKLPKKEAWRASLQIVALLHKLYVQTTKYVPSDKQLLVVLTILKKPPLQSQILFDISAEDQAIILELLTALYCLRSGIVYVEKAQERLLSDNNPRMTAFFEALSLSIHKHPTGDDTQLFFVRTAHQHGARAMSCHYLDQDSVQRQLPNVVRKDDLNAYRAHAWVDIKMVVLKYFDAICRVMTHDNHIRPQCVKMLQYYREALLNTLNFAWQRFSERVQSNTLVECDAHILAFQQQNVIPIWMNMVEQLRVFADTLLLSTDVQNRLTCLYQRAEYLREDLRQQSFLAYETQNSTIVHKHPVFVKNDVAGAILKYDNAVLTESEKQSLTEQHFQQQLSQLLLICGQEADTSLMPYARLKSFIEYLDKKTQTSERTLDLMAIVLCALKLYHSVNFETDEFSQKVTDLTRVTNAYFFHAIARDVKKRFQWVTQKTTYYYQWFECKAVKEAAEAVYALAEEVSTSPEKQETVKAFYRALYYHKTLLNQTGYYPWGWFFGYADPCQVLDQALNEFQDLVTIGSCSKLMRQEAKESAMSAVYLAAFEKRLQNIHISEHHKEEWQELLAQIKTIKEQYHGLGMLCELKHYLQTQRHKFMCHKQLFYFYGGGTQDQIDGLLVHVEQALANIQPRSILKDRFYLSQKEAVLHAALGPTIQSVSLRAGCVAGEDFFDVFVATEAELPACLNDFQPMVIDVDQIVERIEVPNRQRESLSSCDGANSGYLNNIDTEMSYYSATNSADSRRAVWVKRLYGADQLLAFTGQTPRVLAPAPLLLSPSL